LSWDGSLSSYEHLLAFAILYDFPVPTPESVANEGEHTNPMSTINVLLVGEAFMAYKRGLQRDSLWHFIVEEKKRKEKKGCLGPFNHDKKKKSYKAVKFRNVKAKKTSIKLHWKKGKRKTKINVIGCSDTYVPSTWLKKNQREMTSLRPHGTIWGQGSSPTVESPCSWCIKSIRKFKPNGHDKQVEAFME